MLALSVAMSLDLVVLVLTTIGLVRSPGRSALWQLLFGQGIIFFLIAFAANMVATIFLLIHLNRAYFISTKMIAFVDPALTRNY